MSYIIDFKPTIINHLDTDKIREIEYKIINKISISRDEINYLLDYVIYITRYKINNSLDNYENKCDLAQSILYYYFNNLKCSISSCMTQNVITNNIIGHSFLVISVLVENELNNYLLDPTYIQFFTKEKCNNDRYFINPKYPNNVLITPDPGYFIKKEHLYIIEYLLNHGYSLLTNDIAQVYGDSFYNTKVGVEDKSFKSIPGNIYINAFLKGKEKLSKIKEELEKKNLNINLCYKDNNKKVK